MPAFALAHGGCERWTAFWPVLACTAARHKKRHAQGIAKWDSNIVLITLPNFSLGHKGSYYYKFVPGLHFFVKIGAMHVSAG